MAALERFDAPAGPARPACGVAVTRSPAQRGGPELVGTVRSGLAAPGLDPRRLGLGITDGPLMPEVEPGFATLRALRGIGVSIAIDDIGTGHASPGVLRAASDPGAAFGMSTGAEGVDAPERMQGIRAGGCTPIQGCATGRPMPPDTIAAMSRAQAGGSPGTDAAATQREG